MAIDNNICAFFLIQFKCDSTENGMELSVHWYYAHDEVKDTSFEGSKTNRLLQ